MSVPQEKERVMLFEPGDRVEVATGAHRGKLGRVAEVKNGKVFVRSDAYPEGTPKSFKPSDLRRLNSGELSSPELNEPVSEFGELSSLDSVETPEEKAPIAATPEWEHGSPDFENHPFPMNGNSVPQTRELSSPKLDAPSPVDGNSVPQTRELSSPKNQGDVEIVGNHVPQSAYLEPLECLRDAIAKDALRDRWLHEEVSGVRGVRYRLRWREQGRLHSRELSKEEFGVMRDRIAAGRALVHCDALLKYLRSFSE
jgi:hypothetical protein